MRLLRSLRSLAMTGDGVFYDRKENFLVIEGTFVFNKAVELAEENFFFIREKFLKRQLDGGFVRQLERFFFLLRKNRFS